MRKIYSYKNGVIVVSLPEESNREKLYKVTEEFLKKVISGRKNHGNSHTS